MRAALDVEGERSVGATGFPGVAPFRRATARREEAGTRA
jgi:hypothetical protein